jgi:predicted GIY-YIG superfamily endonuclease
MSETTLYRLFDQGGELLYVGISGRWVRRLASHAARQGWWDDVASVTRQPFPSRSEALEAEATAIRQERPRYNVQGKPRPAPPPPAPGGYLMPVLPPSRPGEPESILWIEGLTTREAAERFAAEQLGL